MIENKNIEKTRKINTFLKSLKYSIYKNFYSLLISETKKFHQLAQMLNNHYFLYNFNKPLKFNKLKFQIINSGSDIE
jgi:hypothetical protein